MLSVHIGTIRSLGARASQTMKPLDYLIVFTISIVLMVGVYQFYFWCQRQIRGQFRSLEIGVDSRIPYCPNWVWVYSGLYYPVILLVILSLRDPRHYLFVVFSYLVLLIFQMAIFLAFPVAVPPCWRSLVRGDGPSERLLRFVHRFDAPSNCFPSMHVSVATLTALHLQHGYTGPWILAFPILIALSAIFTKQHFILDLPPGAVLGWLVFNIYKWLYM